MNAQMLFIVCFSASFLITCAGLMLILKRQQQQTASTSVLARLTFRPCEGEGGGEGGGACGGGGGGGGGGEG